MSFFLHVSPLSGGEVKACLSFEGSDSRIIGIWLRGHADESYHAHFNSRVCLGTQSVSSNPSRTAMKWIVFSWLPVTVGEVVTLDMDQ